MTWCRREVFSLKPVAKLFRRFCIWRCNTLLRINHVKQSSVFIGEAVPLAGAASTALGGAKRVGFVVLGLKMLPAADLVLPLNVDASHGESRIATSFKQMARFGDQAPASDEDGAMEGWLGIPPPTGCAAVVRTNLAVI